MSGAGQQMALLKSFRTKSSMSRREAAVPKAKPPPLPPCPKPPPAEECAASGDPYGGQRGAIFQCSISGFKKWYDKQTWHFFEQEDLLYLAHSPRSRRMARARARSEAAEITDAIVAGAGGAAAPSSPGRRVKKAAAGGTDSLNARELSELLKDAKKGKLTKKQKKKLMKKELQLQQKSNRKSANPPTIPRGRSTEPDRMPSPPLPMEAAPAPPNQNKNYDSNNNNAAVPAADRLTHAMSTIKALRVHIDAIDAGDIPGVATPPCTEVELSQQIALILKLCGSFSSHAWSVARSGCVGALAVVATHYLLEQESSMVPLISDALATIALIVGLLFDAQKNGSKKGLKRSLKPDLVRVGAIAVVQAATSRAAGGALCKILLEAGVRLLQVLCDEMCGLEPLIMGLHENISDDRLPRGRRDFVAAGGIHAFLVASHGEGLWSETTRQGKTCRVLLKRFSAMSLKAVRDDVDGAGRDLADSATHCTKEMINAALDKELARRMSSKNRMAQAAAAPPLGSREEQQEKRLAELARREKMRRFNEDQAAKAREERKIMTARIEKAAQDREDEQIRVMEERQLVHDARRTELVRKRAELDKAKQDARLRKMEQMRRASEQLATAKLRKEEANQASYEQWKATKQAQKERDALKRKMRRQQEHDANVKLLQDLQSRLKENVQRRNKTKYEVQKIPTPPPPEEADEAGYGRFERSYAVKNAPTKRPKERSKKKGKKVANERYSPRADMEQFFSKAPSSAMDGFEGLSVIGMGGRAR